MQGLNDFLAFLDGILGAAWYFPWLLLGVGVFFTLYLGFPQIRYFKRAWLTLTGRYTRHDAEGDTSHFQALSTALSGTVGTGNIGGVALALHLGGPAALFWMWATAFVGMTTKFVEVTVSHKYRVKDDKGEMAGGPMYYMERALNMKWLAVFFAIATIFSTLGSGNMPQSNNMASGLHTSFGIPTWVSGALFAFLLGLVILGGIRRIARVTSAIVPIMGLLYFVGALAVIIANIGEVVPAFFSVFSSAFTDTAATGGFLGATFAYAFNRGVNRGLFSNEAGQGSAPIAHASARGDEPVSEGMVSLLEPFIDTLVICTLTGLVILSSGVWKEKFETDFQAFDTQFISGDYRDDDPAHVDALFHHLNARTPAGKPVEPANGSFNVVDGRLADAGITILHNRSIAEDVRIFTAGGAPYSGRHSDQRRLAGRRHIPARQVPAAFRAADGGGVQAQFPGRLRPVRGDPGPDAVRVQHRHRLVLLRRSRNNLPGRAALGAALPPVLLRGVLYRRGGRYLHGLAALRGDPGADGAAEPDRHHAAAPGHEADRARLLAPF